VEPGSAMSASRFSTSFGIDTGLLTQEFASVSHRSMVHALPSSQDGAGPAMQVPVKHVSSPLQNAASAQEVPSGKFKDTQVALDRSKTRFVQGFPSSHVGAAYPVRQGQPGSAGENRKAWAS